MVLYIIFFGLLLCRYISAIQDLQDATTDGSNSRRVGGAGSSASTFIRYRYVVALSYDEELSSTKFPTCSGAIVHRNLVLTAAHCVTTWDHATDQIKQIVPSKTSVYVGADSYRSYVFKVEAIDISVHPDYVDQLTADLAIVTTASDMVGPWLPGGAIGLSCALPLPTNSSIRVLGYGMDGVPRKDKSAPLRTGLMSPMDYQVCIDAFEDYRAPPEPQRNLCLFSRDTQILPGDSGGPVVYEDELIGVMKGSFVPAASDYTTYPDGFDRYATAENLAYDEYKDWIKSQLPSAYNFIC